MITIELFAGAGLAAAGLAAAGCRPALMVEKSAAAAEALALNFPDAPILCGDVAEVDFSLHGGADLLWASPPCQPYSHAGRQLGADDDRDAWPITLQAIAAARPIWTVIENVRGTPIDQWCAELSEFYPHVSSAILNAANYGVPQHRRRIFIVAGPRPFRFPEPTHSKTPKQGDLWRAPLAPWATIGGALGLAFPALPSPPMCRPGLLDRPSPTVCATESKGCTVHSGRYHVVRASDAIALASGYVCNPRPLGARRGLTVSECLILQGAPDHQLAGNQSDRYRQAGNGVPPIMAELIARAISAQW